MNSRMHLIEKAKLELLLQGGFIKCGDYQLDITNGLSEKDDRKDLSLH